MQANQSASGLNRGLLSNFWWLRSANHVKFTEECMMFMEKYVLGTKMFTNGLNMGLPLQDWEAKVKLDFEYINKGTGVNFQKN